MMFPPSHDEGDNLETMSKMIQKKKTKKPRVKVWSDLKIHYFQKLPEF